MGEPVRKVPPVGLEPTTHGLKDRCSDQLSHRGMKRMGRDSNPRWRCRHNGFQDRLLPPLRHPSTDFRTPERMAGDSNPQSLFRRTPAFQAGRPCRSQAIQTAIMPSSAPTRRRHRAPSPNRTGDLRGFSSALYQLSYKGNGRRGHACLKAPFMEPVEMGGFEPPTSRI